MDVRISAALTKYFNDLFCHLSDVAQRVKCFGANQSSLSIIAGQSNDARNCRRGVRADSGKDMEHSFSKPLYRSSSQKWLKQWHNLGTRTTERYSEKKLFQGIATLQFAKRFLKPVIRQFLGFLC